MPRVLSYTPAWLSRPGPGFRLFSEDGGANPGRPDTEKRKEKHNQCSTQRRVLAHRGSEVFVAVDNVIRWTDLATMKDDWEGKVLAQSYTGKREDSVEDQEFFDSPSFRVFKQALRRILLTTMQVLKLQYVSETIQQLIASPNKQLLAVVTDHTVHICVLPASTHLEEPDSGPIRPKTFTVGPTTHVLSQARIISALWHPLGVNGTCLVTVTEDAVVRLWELNTNNRWSTEEPTIAVDLKKLQFASCSEDDVRPERLGMNRGFSTDAIGMDVASACFGGRGVEEEGAWSAMTLWVAMTEGDVYSLCPVLPSKWQPPSSLIPSLTTSVAAKREFFQGNRLPGTDKQACEYQFAWLKELDKEDPIMSPGESEFSELVPIYNRPKAFSSVPQLQGPFSIAPGDVEDVLDIADIAVIAPRLDTEDLYQDDDDAEETRGLTSSLVCLLTKSGRVYICLDLDGVEGKWLPRKASKSQMSGHDENLPELIVLEALETSEPDSTRKSVKGVPTFSADIHSRYAFFVTHNHGVFYLSTESLIQHLENELEADNSAGLQLRLEAIIKGSHVLREQILRFREEDLKGELSAPIVIQDSDLGYFLLTTNDGLPYAAILDTPREALETSDGDLNRSRQYREETPAQVLLTNPRPAYQIPKYFEKPFLLDSFIDMQGDSRYKNYRKEEIRLSAATLEVITEAHRLLSKETNDIQKHVSDLFIRCDQMRHELRNQIEGVRRIGEMVDNINGEDAGNLDDNQVQGSRKLDERLQRTRDRYAELKTRHDALKKKMAIAVGRPLSEKERGWVKEVDKLGKALLPPEEDQEALARSNQEYRQRFEEVSET